MQSTVQKGDTFENICYQLITGKINNWELGIIPNSCKVFQKKRYYSKDREKEIEFDISIEVWLPEADTFSFLYLIECKNYTNKKVPVDDIEEFYVKVSQVSGLNVKAAVISRNSFQEGGYNFARSKKIMLLETNENVTLNIILYKTNEHRSEILENDYLLNQEVLDDPVIQSIIQGKWERKIEKKLIQAFIDKVSIESKGIEIDIPELSSEQIEIMVEDLLNSFDPKILQNAQSMNWSLFKKFFTEIFNVTFSVERSLGVDSYGNKIISSCSFTERVIYIDQTIVDRIEEKYAVAHEMGHFLLHDKLSISQEYYEGFKDDTKCFFKGHRDIIEWQANQFANNLLIPKGTLVRVLFEQQKRIGKREGKIFLDNQLCNIEDYEILQKRLSAYFNVPDFIVEERLTSLNLIDSE